MHHASASERRDHHRDHVPRSTHLARTDLDPRKKPPFGSLVCDCLCLQLNATDSRGAGNNDADNADIPDLHASKVAPALSPVK